MKHTDVQPKRINSTPQGIAQLQSATSLIRLKAQYLNNYSHAPIFDGDNTVRRHVLFEFVK